MMGYRSLELGDLGEQLGVEGKSRVPLEHTGLGCADTTSAYIARCWRSRGRYGSADPFTPGSPWRPKEIPEKLSRLAPWRANRCRTGAARRVLSTTDVTSICARDC